LTKEQTQYTVGQMAMRLHESIEINEAELIAIEIALTKAPLNSNLIVFIDNNNARNYLNCKGQEKRKQRSPN